MPSSIDELVVTPPSESSSSDEAVATPSSGSSTSDGLDLKRQRKLEQARRKEEIIENTTRNAAKNWRKRVAKQGPWDRATDPDFSLDGIPSLPMPVKISPPEDFLPFFEHLRQGGTDDPGTAQREPGGDCGDDIVFCTEGVEPQYQTHLLEFPKGVLYADGRMDLCKQVLGPLSLSPLMDSLDGNKFVRHFLFGNNIIGPSWAQRIAHFVKENPHQIETWYLAGNCINRESLCALVDEFVKSPAITNVWLKRNPLGPGSADALFRLLVETPNLRTLDLDQTSLGDIGVAKLFSRLAGLTQETSIALKHIYLNANGVGPMAAVQIGRYLATPLCKLVSLYLSNNPLGSDGVAALSRGLAQNFSLQRLCLQSVGMSDIGARPLLNAVAKHPWITTLSISHSFATEDLKSRYNWITDAVLPSLRVVALRLQYLDLGYTQLSQLALNSLFTAILESPATRLVYLFANALSDETHLDHAMIKESQRGLRLHKQVMQKLYENVKAAYDEEISYDKWLAEEKRFLISPRDVRNIDSVYRNRDAGMARRGLVRLKKKWDEDDDTLDFVQGPMCRMRR